MYPTIFEEFCEIILAGSKLIRKIEKGNKNLENIKSRN